MNLSSANVHYLIVAAYALVLVILPFALLFWVGRKLEKAFPPEHSAKGVVSRLAFVGLLLWFYFLYANYAPMKWRFDTLERMRNRALTLERVESAGGWNAIVGGCDELVRLPQFYNYSWFGGRCVPPPESEPVALPPALAALNPRFVQFSRISDTNWVLSLRLVAGRRYNYGLRVMCSVPLEKVPELGPPGSPVTVKLGRQLADRVFEF